MTEDEQNLLQQYRRWKSQQQAAFRRFTREEETGIRLPAPIRCWIYRTPPAAFSYDLTLLAWAWLGAAPFAVHFSLRVAMLAFSLLIFLPTRAGSIIASFGGSLSINLIYAALRRFGVPGAMALIGLGLAPVAALLGWAGWLLIQVVRNAIRAHNDTIAWNLLQTRNLLLWLGMALMLMVSTTVQIGSDSPELAVMDLGTLAGLAAGFVFAIAGLNEVLLRSLRLATTARQQV